MLPYLESAGFLWQNRLKDDLHVVVMLSMWPIYLPNFDLLHVRFFLNFSNTIYLHLSFSEAACISLRHILTQGWWESIAIATGYDVTSSRWSGHFLIKWLFFTFLGEKHKILAKAAHCLIMSHSTRLALRIFDFRRFLIISHLAKIQEGGQYGVHLGRRHWPQQHCNPTIYASSCRAQHRLSTKGKIV